MKNKILEFYEFGKNGLMMEFSLFIMKFVSNFSVRYVSIIKNNKYRLSPNLLLAENKDNFVLINKQTFITFSNTLKISKTLTEKFLTLSYVKIIIF